MKPAEPVMRRDWVLCDILVFDGQKVFGDELGNGVYSCAGGGGEDEAYHRIVFLFLKIQLTREFYPRTQPPNVTFIELFVRMIDEDIHISLLDGKQIV